MPEYNPADDVLKKIKQEVKPKRRVKRRMIIIAAVFVVITVMSAAAYYAEITLIDFDGTIRSVEFPAISVSEQETRYTHNFFDSNAGENVVLYVKQQHGGMWRLPEKIIEDYDELKKFLKDFGGGIFKLPEYIPDGYNFTNARIAFYLPDDINYEELEPVYYEEKFGNIYEKYILQESSKIISNIEIRYNRGNIGIDYWIGLLPPNAVGFGGSSQTISVEPELLDIAEFENSMIAGYKNGGSTDWYFSAVISFEPFSVLNRYAATGLWRDEMAMYGLEEYDLLGKAMYRIMSNRVPREEIIKMAESIK